MDCEAGLRSHHLVQHRTLILQGRGGRFQEIVSTPDAVDTPSFQRGGVKTGLGPEPGKCLLPPPSSPPCLSSSPVSSSSCASSFLFDFYLSFFFITFLFMP